MATPEALFRSLARVRNRARVRSVLGGLAWLIAIVGGASLATALVDRGIHIDDPTIRAGILAGILSAGAWIVWIGLIRPLADPLSRASLAEQIEQRFPGFEERLRSSVQFLESQNDATLGSPALQKRVISETLERSAGLEFHQAVSFAPLKPVAATAGFVVLIAVALTCLSPKSALLAARRVFVPYSAPAWPRRNDLRLLSTDFQQLDPESAGPLRIVRGKKLELFVEDRNDRLPDDVQLEYRVGEGAKVREPLRHASLRDRAGTPHDIALLSLPADRGPVWFRAVGGDDATMRELEMRVVPPPLMESISIKVTPPPYTGKPAETLPTGAGRICGVIGTRVSFQGRATKPLASARLVVKSQAAGTVAVKPQTAEFSGGFVIAEAGVYPYFFHLQDLEGIEGGEGNRYEIEATADLRPEVAVEHPSSDLTVTSEARVPIIVSAKDDLGLRSMRLAFHLGDNAEGRETQVPLGAELMRIAQHRATYTWNIGELAASEGMRIVYHAEATDWFDLGPAHVGKSVPRALTIVSTQQKEAEIVARQADLLRVLERSEQTQLRARQQTGDLDVQVAKAGQLRPADLDVLKRIQSDQRQLGGLLANPADGASALVRTLLDELKQNGVSSPQTQQRLERFERELAEVRESHVPAIDDQITQAIKSAEIQQPGKPNAASNEQGKFLGAARREQGIVLESLKHMLGELAQWRDWETLHEAFRELVESQARLNGETADVSHSTLARPLAELTRQDQANLARLAERQAANGDQLEAIKQRLKAAAKTSEDTRRAAGAAAAGLLKSLEQTVPDAAMREIAGQLSQNKIGQAMARQQQVLDELRKADKSLNKDAPADLDSLVERLGDAEQSIEGLHKNQRDLRARTRRLAAKERQPKAESDELMLKSLRQEQSRLKDEAEQAARELRRLGADAAEERLRQAAEHMSGAEQDLEQGASAQADSEQKEALDQLDQARAETRQLRQRVARRLSRESMVRITDEIRGLEARQKGVIDETRRLESERAQRGNWSRGQLKSLAAVADVETRLQAEAGQIAERLKNIELYAWALRRAEGRMQEAAERLGGRLTDDRTIAIESEALSGLRTMIEALARRPNKGSSSGRPSDDSPQGSDDNVEELPEFTLLKTIQQDLLRRTAELERRRSASPTEAQADLARLATEQGELADLFERIMTRHNQGEGRRERTGNRSQSERP